MGKITRRYQLMEWIELDQAIAMLDELFYEANTFAAGSGDHPDKASTVTEREVLQWAASGLCEVWLECSNCSGQHEVNSLLGGAVTLDVIGRGISRVEDPLQLLWIDRAVGGLIKVRGTVDDADVLRGVRPRLDVTWHVKVDQNSWRLLFCPKQIESMADTLWLFGCTSEPHKKPSPNLVSEQDLLVQRLAAAEAEIHQLRMTLATTVEEDGSDKLNSGLTFPYVTPELEALHALALKHWARDYDPPIQPPSQKSMQNALRALLSIPDGAEGRRIETLASVVRPVRYRR